jgi:hypothetical protein
VLCLVQLLRMLSCFPSAKDENGGTKGGMILAKITPTNAGSRTAPLSFTLTRARARVC